MTYVYPLKFLFALGARFYSEGRLSAEFDFPATGELYDLFAIQDWAMPGWRDHRAAQRAQPSQASRDPARPARSPIARRVVGAWFLIAAGVGTLLALVAFLTPVSLVWPAWIYVLLPVIRPVYGVQSSRYLKRQFGEAGTAGKAAQSGPSASC